MTITLRQSIAVDADASARWWVKNPHRPKPTNPYCPIVEPEHFACWRASFERSLLLHSSDEVSA